MLRKIGVCAAVAAIIVSLWSLWVAGSASAVGEEAYCDQVSVGSTMYVIVTSPNGFAGTTLSWYNVTPAGGGARNAENLEFDTGDYTTALQARWEVSSMAYGPTFTVHWQDGATFAHYYIECTPSTNGVQFDWAGAGEGAGYPVLPLESQPDDVEAWLASEGVLAITTAFAVLALFVAAITFMRDAIGRSAREM